MSEDEYNKEILEKVKGMIPGEAGNSSVEFEGPDVAIYVDNIAAIYKDEAVIKNISASVKKRLIVRSNPSKLMDQEEATKKIREALPADAGVGPDGIRFVPEFCEVYIEALKPGLVIGKGGSTLMRIINDTNWVPRVLRQPTMNSDVIKGVRQLMFKDSAFRKKFLGTMGKKINRIGLKSEWIKATPLGGFKEVGRSSTLIETNHSKILIDCGISPEPGIRGHDANKD